MRCPKYTVLGISGSWGNVGFTPLLRSLAQTESILATSPPRVPAVWALPSPPHIASTPPSDHDPLLPRTLALHWSEHSPDSEARIPALAAGPQPDSHQEPQLCTPVRRGPLCLENLSSQDSFLSFKAVQVSPLPGSPLRSHHGTLQLPPHLTQHLWELSSYLASFWSFPHLPPVSLLLPLVPLTLCWVSQLLFSLLVPLSPSSRPLLMLVPASVVSSPLTSWHIHSSPQGPAPKSATCPISPHLPSRHQQALGALVPLKCFQLCLFSALGLSPSPQRRDLSCTPSVGPVGCEQGRLGLGLGGQTWTLPCGTATCQGLSQASQHTALGAL